MPPISRPLSRQNSLAISAQSMLSPSPSPPLIFQLNRLLPSQFQSQFPLVRTLPTSIKISAFRCCLAQLGSRSSPRPSSSAAGFVQKQPQKSVEDGTGLSPPLSCPPSGQANTAAGKGSEEAIQSTSSKQLLCCGLFCPLPISRALDQLLEVLMGAVHSSSSTSSASSSSFSSPCHSPERRPPTLDATIEVVTKLLGKKPVRMNYGMQRAVQLLVAASPDEKKTMLDRGVLLHICSLINDFSNLDLPPLLLNDHCKVASVNSLDMLGGDHGDREGRKKFIVGGGSGEKRKPTRRSSTQQGNGTEKGSKRAGQKRPGSAESTRNNGVGYGRGSTKSRWNMERALQEKTLHEEHLIWLVSALIGFLWSDQLVERVGDWEMALGHKGGERRRSVPTVFQGEMPAHLQEEGLAEQILRSAVFPLLAHHLGNDSVLDVSQHMELYQVLFELTAGLAAIPALLPHLVLPQGANGKSIAKEMIPQFRDNLNNYPTLVRGIGEADGAFMDFIRKINDFTEVILRMARQFERQIPVEKRIKTSYAARYKIRVQPGGATQRRRSLIPIGTVDSSSSLANIVESSREGPLSQSSSYTGLFNSNAIQSARQRTGQRRMPRQMSREEIAELSGQTLSEQYGEVLRELQMSTWKLINDAGKPVLGFSFKKELRSVNPFSPTHKDRTKRIAKELASMHNSLPLNASNAIFVCLDETRCDMLKVLISGPDDTPYQNGLFEFDVFFPVNYPQQPPKCSFLTTGAGNVRFNPNLYNDGKICLSILGTWEGRPEEKWNPFCSLLQVLISIQGLIFVRQPYFNEPGFEKFQGTPKGEEFSRKYNLHIENATLVYAIFEQWKNGPAYWQDIIRRHFWLKRDAIIRQAERWLQEVAEDIKSSSSQSKDETDGMIDGIFSNPVVQRQNVRKLIEAFRDMPNPLLEDMGGDGGAGMARDGGEGTAGK